MPIYEYECPACGVVEVFQGINEAPLRRCPECKRRKVKKLISESSFHLKGSGWYVTDYGRGNGNGRKPRSDKEESGESASGKEKSSSESAGKETSAS